MTIEEKRLALDTFCIDQAGCANCPLGKSHLPCDFTIDDDPIIEELYGMVFPDTTEEPHIKDSGSRTEFPSGAVRDMGGKDKGRCDLMPLDVAARIMTPTDCLYDPDLIVGNIALFKDKGDTFYLYQALSYFAKQHLESIPNMLLEVSKHFAEGCEKYGENNWMKGIPVKSYINSGVRHYLKYLRGDKDENHHLAFCWNLMCAVWTCDHKPELNEYAKKICPVCNTVIPDGDGQCPHCRVHVTDPDWDMADYEEENK